MADDEKKPVSSLPPPTEEVDEDWGSSAEGSSKPSEKAASAKTKSDSSAASKSKPAASKKASARDEEDEDDDEEEDDDEDDDRSRDDDEDDDDEDDDDEDDDDRRKAQSSKARGKAQGGSKSHGQPPHRSKGSGAPASDDWLPDWAPWATLGALLLFGFLGGLGVIPLDFNLKKSEASPETPATAAAKTTKPAGSASARAKRPGAPGAMGDAADEEKVAASHLLVSFQGAMRAQPSVTRTKEEAKQRAQQALARAKKGEPFEKLVAEFSDEPGAAARGGKLGKFSRRAMVKEFSDAAFAMKVGQISDIVETKFGFHVIKRTE